MTQNGPQTECLQAEDIGSKGPLRMYNHLIYMRLSPPENQEERLSRLLRRANSRMSTEDYGTFGKHILNSAA